MLRSGWDEADEGCTDSVTAYHGGSFRACGRRQRSRLQNARQLAGTAQNPRGEIAGLLTALNAALIVWFACTLLNV